MKREEAIHFATCLKNNWTINFADMEEFCDMAIEALSAEAEWIPCIERLPKTGDDILVTFSDGEVGIIISARPKAWVKYEEANNLIFPIAWMPLPDPYKGE